jgi:hypothetical protein
MSRDWIDDIRDMRALLLEVYNAPDPLPDDLRKRIGVILGLEKRS